MTTASTRVHQIPDEIAQTIVLPDGHLDTVRLFDAYRWLREHEPLGVAHVDGYDPLWLVSKHADIMEIERAPHVFTNGGVVPGMHNPMLQTQAGDTFTKQLCGGTLRQLDTLVFMDPPEHGAVRKVAAEWFRPATLRQWEAVIRGLARKNIDERLASGVHEVDFMSDFATYFPLQVIMKLFGIPMSDEPLMRSLTQDIFGISDPGEYRENIDPLSPEAAAQQLASVIGEFYAYFEAIIDERRKNPTDDLSGIIASAKTESGEFYDKSFAFGWYLAISTAGHDTTSSTLAGIMEQLALQPELLARVTDDPALIPDLVSEGLRWVSPVKHFMRQAAEDYELRDRMIKTGDRLMLLYQCANRDSDVFDDPDEFNIDRRPNKQIAFGTGPHTCIGLHLAKLELRIMFEELLPRIAKLAPTGSPTLLKTNFVGGLRSLPLQIEMK